MPTALTSITGPQYVPIIIRDLNYNYTYNSLPLQVDNNFAVLSMLANLFGTNIGEVDFEPLFGAGIEQLVFQPTSTTPALIYADVILAIQRWLSDYITVILPQSGVVVNQVSGGFILTLAMVINGSVLVKQYQLGGNNG